METVVFGCGCSITRDMFEHKVWNVHSCEKHTHLFFDDYEKMAEKMKKELEG